MRRQWIKLWIDILDDRPFQSLADNLWRFAVELMLAAGAIAGDGEDDGYITHRADMSDLAWRLRRPVNDTVKMIDILLDKTDFLEELPCVDDDTQTYIVIRKFAERQRAMTSTEKSRKYRNDYKNV